MYGDGLPEVLEWDMDNGWVYIHDSAGGYSTYTGRAIGVSAVLL